MRPGLRFLTDTLIERIVAEAVDILSELGVTIHNREVVSILSDHGAKVDAGGERVRLTAELIERSLRSAPSSFKLYDVLGTETHDFQGDAVYFTPGSTALNLLKYPIACRPKENASRPTVELALGTHAHMCPGGDK